MKNHFWSVVFVNLLVSLLFGSIFYGLFQLLGRYNVPTGGEIAGILILFILIFAIGAGISTIIGVWVIGDEDVQSFALANFFLFLIMTILVVMGRFMLAAG